MPVVAAMKNKLLAGRWTMSTAEGPQPHAGFNGARFRKYAAIDLAGITVRRAVSDDDFALVGRLREAGFSRVANGTAVEWVDDFDRSPGVFSLIAYNSLNEPVATMRVQDGRVAELELGRFVPLGTLLAADQRPAAQFARLSVIKAHQSTDAMFGLFKAAWRWCLGEKLKSIVIATPPWSRPVYDFMFFEEMGRDGQFDHKFAGGTLHVSMRLPVQDAEDIWRTGLHPLSEHFIDRIHPSLIILSPEQE